MKETATIEEEKEVVCEHSTADETVLVTASVSNSMKAPADIVVSEPEDHSGALDRESLSRGFSDHSLGQLNLDTESCPNLDSSKNPSSFEGEDVIGQMAVLFEQQNTVSSGSIEASGTMKLEDAGKLILSNVACNLRKGADRSVAEFEMHSRRLEECKDGCSRGLKVAESLLEGSNHSLSIRVRSSASSLSSSLTEKLQQVKKLIEEMSTEMRSFADELE